MESQTRIKGHRLGHYGEPDLYGEGVLFWSGQVTQGGVYENEVRVFYPIGRLLTQLACNTLSISPSDYAHLRRIAEEYYEGKFVALSVSESNNTANSFPMEVSCSLRIWDVDSVYSQIPQPISKSSTGFYVNERREENDDD